MAARQEGTRTLPGFAVVPRPVMNDPLVPVDVGEGEFFLRRVVGGGGAEVVRVFGAGLKHRGDAARQRVRDVIIPRGRRRRGKQSTKDTKDERNRKGKVKAHDLSTICSRNTRSFGSKGYQGRVLGLRSLFQKEPSDATYPKGVSEGTKEPNG
jgi:hypothetical protein